MWEACKTQKEIINGEHFNGYLEDELVQNGLNVLPK